jgi:hypothetical protein
MAGFLIQQPWADLIVGGKKTWELRTQPVHLPRAPFYILATSRPHAVEPNYDASRLGVAVGIAESDGIEGPFTVEELHEFQALHMIPEDALRKYAGQKKLYAMKLKAKPIEPKSFRYMQGAVTIIANVEFT